MITTAIGLLLLVAAAVDQFLTSASQHIQYFLNANSTAAISGQISVHFLSVSSGNISPLLESLGLGRKGSCKIIISRLA